MKVLIPDSVADEVHEREVPEEKLVGITGWKKLIHRAHELDSEAVGLDPLDRMEFARAGGVSAVYGDFSGRGQYVGCVIGPPKAAKLIARFLLSQWRR